MALRSTRRTSGSDAAPPPGAELEELRHVFENGAVAICCIDAGGLIVRANIAELKLLDYQHGEYVGHHVREFYEQPELIEDMLQRAAAGDVIHGLEARIGCANGVIRDVSLDASGFFRDGRFVHAVCFTRDRTARKEAANRAATLEREMQQHLEELRVLFNAAPMGIAITADPSCRRIDVNPVMAELLGVRPGDNVSLLVPPDKRPAFRFERDGVELSVTDHPVHVAARTGQLVPATELEVIRADGSSVTLLGYGAPIKAPTGEIRGALAVFIDISVRKEAERVLRASEERWRSLANALPALVCIAAPDGTIQTYNDRWYEYTGMAREKMPGRPWREAMHGDDYDQVVAAWQGALEDGRGIESEFRLRRLDGVYRWHLGRTTPVRTSSGDIDIWIITVVDIDDRKRTEETLRESEQRFRGIVETANEGVLIINAEVGVAYVNERFAAMLGYTREEALGRTLFDFIDPELHAVVEQNLARRRQGVREQFEFRFRRKDGQPLWGIVGATPLYDASGAFGGSLTVITDISERKQIEEALRDSETRARAVLETAVDAIITIDERGTIESVNGAVERLFGYASEELIGRNVNLLMPEQDASRHDTYLRNYLETGIRRIIGIGREVVAQRKDGSTFPVDLAVSELQLGDRRLFTGIIHDITERKQAAAEVVRQSEQLRLITDALPVLISYVDAGLRYRFNNKAYTDWFGSPVEDVSGKHLREVLGDAAYQVILPYVERVLSGEMVVFEDLLRYEGAGDRYVQVTYVPDRADGGTVRGFFALVQDLTQRKRAEDEQRLLRVIGDSLNASLDYEATIHSLVSSAVQEFADFCAVYMRAPDGSIERISTGATEPTRHESMRFTTLPPSPLGVPDVLRTGRSLLFGAQPDATLEQAALSEEHAAMLKQASIASGIVVPIRVRDEIVGAMSLATMQSSRTFDERDLELAQEIARRAGLAVENARLFRDLRGALLEADEARTLLSRVTATSPTGIGFWDREFRCLMMNEALATLWDTTLERHLGRTVEDAIPVLWPLLEPSFRRALSGDEVLDAEITTISREGGHVRYALGSYYPVRLAGGEIIGVAATIIDITERRRAEDAQQLLVRLGDALTEPRDFASTAEAIARSFVPGFAEAASIISWTDDGMLEREAVTADDPAQIDRGSARPAAESAGVQKVLRDGVEQFHPRMTADAAQLALAGAFGNAASRLAAETPSVMVLPLRARQEIIAVLTLVRASPPPYDLRDLELARESARRSGLALENARLFEEMQQTLHRLEEALATKDDFLGMVSHELKTPITTIYGNAEVLRTRADALDVDSRKAALNDISKDADRLHRIIDNLLVLARLERGQTIASEPVLVRRILEPLVVEHRQHYPHRAIDLRVETPVSPVAAEQLYLEQIVRNLLSNAEKYSPDTEKIEVQVTRDAGYLLVSVLDRGPGVPDDEIDSIFTPFYRSPNTSGNVSGVGVGLAVCRRLVEAHGGHMWALNREGGGADIGFALPIVEEFDDET
jgi:PAS domain S-box-containing protein